VTTEEQISFRFKTLKPFLSERACRLLAATEVKGLGHGGIATVSVATGLSRNTIVRGLSELKDKVVSEDEIDTVRVRKEGGGRRRAVDNDPTIREDLDRLVSPATRGDPMSPLRWTCKSLRNLEEELQNLGHKISYRVVGELLKEMDYSLQGARKTLEGTEHPDRNAQFEHINAESILFLNECQPAISIDTKKKEIVGNFKNQGREWQPQGNRKKC
jgi:transposase